MALFKKFLSTPATLATPATLPGDSLQTVASVATVAGGNDGENDQIIRWRTKTGRTLYLVTSERLRRMAPDGKAVFNQTELEHMRGLPEEAIERIIDAKEIFPGAEVEG